MKTTTKMKISLVLAVGFLLVFSESLFACHQFKVGVGGYIEGHSNDKVMNKSVNKNSAFGITSQITFRPSTSSTYATTDSTVTSSDCNARISKIQEFFDESYEQIAEESAQGSGQHLEALASLTGCSTEQYGTFETAMNRNHRYVFADKDYDGSINNFFTVLNTDEDLKQCFGHS